MTTPYDLVPYTSYPYPQTQPERLATLATVFSLRPPDVRRCRVLELGSSSGGNLLPAAERFPDATFVGLDASARQIEIGREFLSRLDVPNLRLEHRDLMDVTPQDGQYDYILCHGVYSWVPPQVQDKILFICRHNIAPNGVAYVSYNTLPGWHFKGVARDVMHYRARDFTEPSDRLRHARMVLDFLAEAVPPEKDNPLWDPSPQRGRVPARQGGTTTCSTSTSRNTTRRSTSTSSSTARGVTSSGTSRRPTTA